MEQRHGQLEPNRQNDHPTYGVPVGKEREQPLGKSLRRAFSLFRLLLLLRSFRLL